MTTLQRIELQCPVCDTRFISQSVVATNSFGGKRTDFHERAAGTQPLPYLVHMCSRCGYTGAERDFTEDVDPSPLVKEHVWNELAPTVSAATLRPTDGPGTGSTGLAGSAGSAGGTGSEQSSGSGKAASAKGVGASGAVSGGELRVPGSAKYEAAAKVAEWQSMEPRYIADFYLRAAWCCVDEGDVEAERYFRRKAVWSFQRALESYDGVAREERAVLTYLVGELWRRIGHTAAAIRWFDRVPEEVMDPNAQRWVLDAARQQRECPREWFG